MLSPSCVVMRRVALQRQHSNSNCAVALLVSQPLGQVYEEGYLLTIENLEIQLDRASPNYHALLRTREGYLN
jgi:hypothetical protein